MAEQLASSSLTPTELASVGKEYSALGYTVELTEKRNTLLKTIVDLCSMENDASLDAELRSLARMEKDEAVASLIETDESIVHHLTPRSVQCSNARIVLIMNICVQG